jgi:hypothetical protein
VAKNLGQEIGPREKPQRPRNSYIVNRQSIIDDHFAISTRGTGRGYHIAASAPASAAGSMSGLCAASQISQAACAAATGVAAISTSVRRAVFSRPAFYARNGG